MTVSAARPRTAAPYAASDPDLLTWVHVAEVRSFLASYQRYGPSPLPTAAQDRYFAEVARVAEALGAREVPRTRRDIDAYLESMRPHLVFDERAGEVLQLLLHAPAPGRLTAPAGYVMTRAGLDLLPDWARQLAGIRQTHPQRLLFRAGMHTIARVLRRVLRNGVRARAMRRLGTATPKPPTGR